MSKYNYSEVEQQINNVLLYQQKMLSEIHRPSRDEIDERISESETLLRRIGYGQQLSDLQKCKKSLPVEIPRKVMLVPSWEHLCLEAEKSVETGAALEELFTPDELRRTNLQYGS